jgi:hypothetical protein
MSAAEQPRSLGQLLDQVASKADGERVSLGEILNACGNRSYGPALLLIALIELLPVISAIPGLYVITGSLIIMLAAQLLLMRPYPWLPARLLRFSLSRERLQQSVDWARPWARRIDWLVRPRLTFLVRPPMLNVMAAICILLALLFFPLAIIPASEKALAVPIFFFALALTARDGLLALLGLAATGGCVGLLVYLWPSIAAGFAWLLAAVQG